MPETDCVGGAAESVTDVHGVAKVNWSALVIALVPDAVVTVMSTGPTA